MSATDANFVRLAAPQQVPAPTSTADGLRLMADGRLAEAEAELRAVVRANPRDPAAVGYLGVALARLSRLAEAEAAFHLAARLDPENANWCLNLAAARLDRGDPAGGESWARQAILLNPESAEAHRRLGAALERQGDDEPAAAAFGEATRLNPDLWEAHAQHGRVLARLGRFASAEAACRVATGQRPGDPGPWAELATALEKQQKHAEAEPCRREVARLLPESAEAHNYLGMVLHALNREADAVAAYGDALRLRPEFTAARCNLANSLRLLGRLTEAEAACREVIAVQPNAADAHCALGAALAQQGRVPEAIAAYDEAVRLRPDFPEARTNRAMALLSAGEYDRGWADYEYRWKLSQKVGPADCPAPRWDGGPLAGRSILLLAEQGLGDTLQFIRYAPAVKAMGAAEVLADGPGPLADLLGTCPGVNRVVRRGTAATGFHLHAPLLSLPALVGANPPTADVPYLTPPAGRVEHWRRELAGLAGLRVGIAWQGSRSHTGDVNRSVRLARFAPLAAVPGVRLVSLQKGYGTEQLADGSAGFEVTDLGAKTEPGMDDAAAALMALDLLVSVDTSLVHLAGAVGVPVWVLVPFAADWRWGLAGETTHWYPTMRLFRQSAAGDWDTAFARLTEALTERAAAANAGS